MENSPSRHPFPGNNPRYQWRRVCLAAINERDPEKLKEKIEAAEAAMFERALELDAQDDDAERTAMSHAAKSLRYLKVHVLGYPG